MLGEIKKQFPLTLVALRTIGRTKSKWLSVFLVWLIVVFAREACAQSSPAISVQPQDQSVVQGIDAAFSVLASGQAPLAYAWYYEGALLLDDGYHTQGAASPQLIISNALTDDAGSYWVTVSNRHGMVTSKVATLTVIVPPSVTTQPSNQVVSLGVNVAINATATGSSPLSFRWQKDGVNLTDNGHVSGANDSTLTISSVQPGDIGNYRLIVTNVYGATTSAVGNLMVQPLMVWGASNTVPEAFTNAVAVAAGAYHEQYVYLGLKSDSTVAGWGATVPAGLRNVVAVSAGYRHGLALGSDGSVTGFGDNSFGEATPPGGLSNVVDVAAGGDCSVALKGDGTVVGWGYTLPPAGLSNLLTVSAGTFHSLAIKDDGTVTGWGYNGYGEAVPPAGLSNVVAVSAGAFHSLALKSDGTVVAWGVNYSGESMAAPDGLSNVVAVAGGWSHALALRSDGTVVAWVRHDSGQTTTPAGLTNVVAIAAGNLHSLALVPSSAAQLPPVIRWMGSTNRTVPFAQAVLFLPAITGSLPMHFQWLHNNVPLPAETNRWLLFPSTQTAQSGAYSLVITNAAGSVTSSVITLAVKPPAPPAFNVQPASQSVLYGSKVVIPVTVTGTPPLVYRWQKNGANLFDGQRFGGTTATTLAITNVQTSDFGSYQLVVTNLYGSTTSSPAMLSVVPVMSWGYNSQGQTVVPLHFTNVISAEAKNGRSIALRSDGTVAVWPYDPSTVPPAGLSNVVAVAKGYDPCAALKRDGTITAWGPNVASPGNPSNVVAIAMGNINLMTIRSDTTASGLGTVTRSNILSISSGEEHGLMAREDGTVVGWGNNSSGQATAPAGLSNVVAVSAGRYHSLALKSDGTVAAWGYSLYGQTNVPAGLSNIVEIAAGYMHNLALRADGSVVGWGDNTYSESAIPANLSNVVAITGGNCYNVAIVENPATPISPSIWWTGPTNRIVAVGRTAIIHPVVHGSRPMRFQWYFNGSPLPGQTNRWLALTSLTSDQSGHYHVAVTNNHGSAVSPATTLIVGQPPALALQPANQFVVLGRTAVFGTAVLGDEPLGCRWWFKGAPLTDDGRISGAATTNLAIANVGTNDIGTYQLQVSNLFGAATSAPVMLTVLFPPTFVAQPSNQTVVGGGNADLVSLATGTAPLSYNWQREGTNLVDGGSISGVTNATLRIIGAQAADAAGYAVVVTNIAGSVTSTVATVTILPLVITNQPVSRTLPAGTNASFTVGAAGLTPIRYQWRFDQIELPGRTNTSLALSNVQSWHAGLYDVVVSNPYSAITSAAAILNVTPAPPTLVTQPVSRVVSVGQDAVLSVITRGSEPMQCQWQKNGADLPGATSFTLTLSNVNSSVSGNYRATVSNAVGGVFTTNATLVVSPVLLWGATNIDQLRVNTTIPASATNLVAIAAGHCSSPWPCFGLRADGTLSSWGMYSAIPTNAVDVVAVSSGGPGPRKTDNSLALRADGTVVHWYSTTTPALPAAISNSYIVAVAAGGVHQLALRDDGTVIAWGNNSSGQTNVPAAATNVIAIAAGEDHSLALRADGRVIGWGRDTSGQATALSNAMNVVAISAGGNQSLALLADGSAAGSIVTNNQQVALYGPPPADATNLLAVSAGYMHSLGLRANRTVAGWGRTNYGVLDIPPYASNVVSLAAGGALSLGLVSDPAAPPIPPRIARPPLGRTIVARQSAVFNALAVGGPPLLYQWYRNSAPLAGQTNAWLALTNVLPPEAGNYQFVALNHFGAATSAVAVVTVAVPPPHLELLGVAGGGFRFSFQSIAGVLYIAEYRNSLITGAWTDLERRFGSGGLEVVTDSSAAGTRRFYRVRAVYAPPPKLTATAGTTNAVGISFSTVDGAIYVVEYKTNLTDSAWLELSRQSGVGAPILVEDTNPPGRSRFYRIRVE